MIMPELSFDGKGLVREGRLALSPTMPDKERIYAALQTRLNATADVSGSHADLSAGLTAVSKALIGGVALLVAGGAAVLLTRHSTSPNTVPPDLSSLSPAFSVQAQPNVIPAQSADVVVSAPESPVPVAKVPRRAREPIADDRLAEEAALLIRAEKDYHAGKLHKALATTEEHARTFPAGVLRRERVKLRNNIVCQMSADQGSKTPPSSAYPANAGTVSAARCER